MKRRIYLLVLLTWVFLITGVEASTVQNKNAKPMRMEKIQKLDKQLNRHKVARRNFKNQKEFKRVKYSKRSHKSTQRRNSHKSSVVNGRNGSHIRKSSYNRGYYDDYYYENDWDYPSFRQVGYRSFKRGWLLAYKYDRATFNDRYGYHYGYFNRNGYYFEGIFYGYDRYYRYYDRVRGRGLFDRRYYMPSNYNYYGFSAPSRRVRPRAPRPYFY